MKVVLVVYCVALIVTIQTTLINGLICQCSPGLSVREDVNPCEQVNINNTNYYALECNAAADPAVCLVHEIEDQVPKRIIQRCFYSTLYRIGCAAHNYNTMDNGKSLCCAKDYCNSVEAFLEFRANQSSGTSTVGEQTTNLTGATIGIPMASPTVVINATTNATPTTAVNVSTTASSGSGSSPPPYAIALIVVLSFIILVVAIIIIATLSMYCLSWYRNNKKQPIKIAASSCSIDAVSSVDITVSSSDWSAGSDSGLPVLFQAHIARQITREHLIGRGRYGQVWRGYYKGEDVAVKVFQSIEEMSWLHEVDIYNKCGLRHPNILRFIAADRSDAGMFIENWLIAEYCENGNLYDYLQCYVLEEATVVAMAHDIASGLVFIHSVITGTEGKASIAHRDLKSRNILVKKDLSLVIGDFGLAVRHDVNADMVEEAPAQRVGTKRYLAPEILDGTMNMTVFDSFKRADIYSFSLVLWEIVRRGQCNGVVEEPQLPYYDCVPSDPSFEEMQNIVCVEQRRPLIPDRWYESPVFSGLAKLMNECWHTNGEARLKSLRVRRRLEEILRKNCDKTESPKNTAKPS